MADGTVVKHVPANPCCELWKEKLSKLREKLSRSESYRTAFKKCTEMLDKEIAKIQAENLELKKVHEEERMRAANESEEKFKESAMRVSLENEIFALKSDILSLKQKVSSGAEDVGEEVVLLRACVAEGEKEINRLKEHLEKEQMRADSETKKVKAELKKTEAELKKANEAWKTAKVEKARDEKLQEDNEKEMKVKESAFQASLENEISGLKSQITLLQQQAQDMEEEVTLLQAHAGEKETEINRLKELLQIENKRADSVKKKSEEERKKADAEICRAEKLQAENEREEKAKGQAMRVALENEISALKSHILVLQQKAGSDAQDVDNDEPLLKACVSEKETEINQLKELLEKEKTRADFEKKKADEEKKKANEISDKLKAEKSRAEKVLADNEKEVKAKEMAMKLSLENEISALRSQILVLQQGIGVRDVDKEVNLLQERVSKGEAEINQLRGLLEKERTRAEFEKKKFETEKEKANEAQKTLKAEKSRADEERKLAAVEGKKAEEARHQLERLSVEADDLRSKLVSETLKFQQANEKLDTEKQKVIKEKRRADLEMAKVEEQRKLSEINRRRVVEEKSRADCLSQQLEEGIRRLEKLQDIAKHLSSTKLVEAPGNLSIKQMNLETAKLKGRPQLEMMKIEAGAPKLVLDCLKCEELIKKLEDVKQKANREKKRADSEMRKAEEQKKVLEAYEQKAMVEKNRAGQLAQELEDNRRKTGELKEELQELVSSRTLVDPCVSKYMNTEATRRKLLRKELKLEKMQVKHAKQVANLEKGRNVLLQREILRLKEEFSQISNHLDTLDKCFSYGDVGIDDLEKNCSVSKNPSLNLKRKFLAEEPYEMQLQSGNELLKPSYTALNDTDPFKHSVICNAPLLPISRRNCPQSISGKRCFICCRIG